MHEKNLEKVEDKKLPALLLLNEEGKHSKSQQKLELRKNSLKKSGVKQKKINSSTKSYSSKKKNLKEFH